MKLANNDRSGGSSANGSGTATSAHDAAASVNRAAASDSSVATTSASGAATTASEGTLAIYTDDSKLKRGYKYDETDAEAQERLKKCKRALITFTNKPADQYSDIAISALPIYSPLNLATNDDDDQDDDEDDDDDETER